MQKAKKLVQLEESKQAPDAEEVLLKYDNQSKFSIGKMAKYCKNGRFAERIGSGAPIFIAAVLEYIAQEILESAELQMKAEKGSSHNKEKRHRITNRHIMMAIRSDKELASFFFGANFCQAGVMPSFVQKNNKKKKAVDEGTDSEDEDYFCPDNAMSDE